MNQIRGRTMRQDPERPLKVANNWDVLCLSSVGDRADLQRLEDRHDKLFDITDDGQIERGIGHIHACFNQVSNQDLFERLEEINKLMYSRAEERLAVGFWAPLALLALGPIVATPLRLRATIRTVWS